MGTAATVALSAFIAALIRGWRDQENKGPLNALVYKWASRVFILWAGALIVFTIWIAGVAADLWIWPFYL